MTPALSGNIYSLHFDYKSVTILPVLARQMATAKNSFLMIWAEDFGPDKVMEIPEYFVYCGIYITHSWGERFAQIAKGEFLEVPKF